MSVMYVGEGLYIENKADGSLDLDNASFNSPDRSVTGSPPSSCWADRPKRSGLT